MYSEREREVFNAPNHEFIIWFNDGKQLFFDDIVAAQAEYKRLSNLDIETMLVYHIK